MTWDMETSHFSLSLWKCSHKTLEYVVCFTHYLGFLWPKLKMTYTTLRIVYIPVLEILSLTFAQGLISSFKSMLFCVLTCLKLCSFFLTSGSLEIQFLKNFITFIIVWNKLIPFLLHFLGSFYLYIIKFWFNLHSYETPFCKAALATVQSGFIFSYTHMNTYTYTSAVKLRKFVYLIGWNVWMVWKIKGFNVI